MANLSRRLFLRNSAVGALASTVAVPVAVQASEENASFARARYHYDQFAAAMDELTSGYHGWVISGGHRREFSAVGCATISGGAWLRPKLVFYEAGTEPRCRSGVMERNLEIVGLQKQPNGWLDEPLYHNGSGVRL
jgi:hypothetical protein